LQTNKTTVTSLRPNGTPVHFSGGDGGGTESLRCGMRAWIRTEAPQEEVPKPTLPEREAVLLRA
jgi:hypothetical protein